MKTYKITFNLSSKVSFFHIPTFDAILFYAVVKEQLGDKFMQKTSLQKEEYEPIYEFMPIPMQGKRYFLASFAFWNDDDFVETATSYKKRFNTRNAHIINFGKNKKQVVISKGDFKSINNPLPIKDIPQIYFYFNSDNVAKVKELIKNYITGIGKKQSIGFGNFHSFEIEEETILKNFEGLRPIPVLEIEAGKNIQLHGFRPPYWLPENQTFCLV